MLENAMAAGLMSLERGTNTSDSGAYFYDVYECADGRWVSVAPIEARFHAQFLELMGISPAEIGAQRDAQNWDRAHGMLERAFKTRTRDEWCKLLEGTDACFAPVLSMAEAPLHEHLKARQTFVEIDGVVQPAPSPRFSRTVPDTPTPPAPPDAERALEGWLNTHETQALRAAGVL